jgi:hypothetical protein
MCSASLAVPFGDWVIEKNNNRPSPFHFGWRIVDAL